MLTLSGPWEITISSCWVLRERQSYLSILWGRSRWVKLEQLSLSVTF